MPYFVESRLRELGGLAPTGPRGAVTVVVDGNLVTGQNPQSSVDTAKRVADLLS